MPCDLIGGDDIALSVAPQRDEAASIERFDGGLGTESEVGATTE